MDGRTGWFLYKFEHHSIASEGYHSVRSLTVLVYPDPWWDHSSRYSFNVGLYGNIVLTIFFSEPTHYGPWQPCWISNQHQKHKSCIWPSNEHFWQVWFNSVQFWFTEFLKLTIHHQANWIVALQEWSLGGPVLNLWIVFRSEIQDGCHDLT
jgi:hypothetical protein